MRAWRGRKKRVNSLSLIEQRHLFPPPLKHWHFCFWGFGLIPKLTSLPEPTPKPILRSSVAVSVQSLSYVLLFVTPGTAAHQAFLSFTPSLFKFMPIELVMPSNHLILCLLLLILPSIFPSIRVFSNELALHMRWPKNWSFSFSISSSCEYSGLISFRIYWFDLLAIQGTLKSLLQHHSSKASIFWHSTFFMVQLSHPYMTTGKP